MMCGRKTYSGAIVFLFASLLSLYLSSQNKLTSFVDPFIGTDAHGHTYPGASVPFGMVQLSPDTRVDGSWDGCSGYHYSDSLIYGFSHTHLSGTGCSDYGDILFMPSNKSSLDNKKYASTFTHKNENASAGYYSVLLDNKINAELTVSTRCGFHRYTFPQQDFSYVVLDLLHRDKTLQSQISVIDNTHISGMRRSEAWAKDQHVYFYAEFSQPFTVKEARNFFMKKNPDYKGVESGVVLSFRTKDNRELLVKVGISFVSIEGAKKNLEAEISHWDFNKTKLQAEELWEQELNKIVVEGNTDEKKKIFYTALYHCMLQPNIANDVDGSYRGRDNKIHSASGHNYYTVFSLWDTFRAEHPLFTIIDRKRTSDFVKTFLLQYQQGGRLPVWELASNETDCMIGYHSVSVINDAISKGIRDFDLKLAMEAMKKSATWNHLGLPSLMKKNYIEAEDEHESVSKTLEYAYDDWCIAQTARLLSRADDYQYFMRRSQSWKNMFDPETRFMRPRRNGGWHSPFDPKEVNNYFTEGNSWQYSFFVPHDIEGLINGLGGENALEQKLDQLFAEDSKTTGRDQADITGLIGQYAHGNEPSHHMSYLYNYAGAPHKTQTLTTKILNELYKATPDGLCGNEDCGQMSAWYVLSAMGIYQVCPGSGFFDISMPLFDKVTINLEDGKQFVISVVNPELRKNEKARLGRVDVNELQLVWTKLGYSKIAEGGKMEMLLTDDVVQYWGNFFGDPPPVPEKDYSIYEPVPVISAQSKTFRDSLEISIASYAPGKFPAFTLLQDTSVRYLDTMLRFEAYKAPFYIKNSTYLLAVSKQNGSSLYTETGAGEFALAAFHKIPNNWKIEIKSRYNPQYTAGGAEGIIDGLRGDENWRKGGWQGYQSQNFEAIIDLNEVKNISEVSCGFLQDTRSWILMPRQAEISFSEDGKKFSKTVVIKPGVKDKDYNVQIKELIAQLPKQLKARYIKVKAVNYGKLPAWHEGAGGDAFIFIDEISVR